MHESGEILRPWRDRVLWLAVALCVVVRLGVLLVATPDYTQLARDPDGYGAVAATLADGGGFALAPGESPTAKRPPLYSLFLAPFYLVGLGRTVAPLAAQAFFDGATTLVLYVLTLLLMRRRGAALAAAFAWALYLPEATTVTRLWSEPLSALLVTASLAALTAALQRSGALRFGVAGLLLGLASLARATMLPVSAVLGVFALCRPRAALRPRLVGAAALAVGLALALAPWAARNAAVFHAFVPVSTHGGHTVYGGNAALDEKDFLRIVEGPEVRAKLLRTLRTRGSDTAGLDEEQIDRTCQSEVRRLVRENPGRFALLSLVRFCRLWFNVGFGRAPSIASLGVAAVNGALLALALVGLWLGRGRWLWDAAPLLLVIALVSAVHVVTVAYVRYTFPLMPPLLAVTAAAWARRLSRYRPSTPR